MRILADRETCASSGMCALTAPDLFDQDEADGRVLLLRDSPDADREEAARKAVRYCPARALSWHKD
jgi:ferredoxin